MSQSILEEQLECDARKYLERMFDSVACTTEEWKKIVEQRKIEADTIQDIEELRKDKKEELDVA